MPTNTTSFPGRLRPVALTTYVSFKTDAAKRRRLNTALEGSKYRAKFTNRVGELASKLRDIPVGSGAYGFLSPCVDSWGRSDTFYVFHSRASRLPLLREFQWYEAPLDHDSREISTIKTNSFFKKFDALASRDRH
ncbi:MAG: hypothetical protein ACI9W2_002495 [Gammaproteobacteria bacterium]|jgi:hypothetical protein